MLEILKFQCYLIYFYREQEFYHVFLFLFLVVLYNFLIILVVKENIRVKLALAIPTVAPIRKKK